MKRRAALTALAFIVLIAALAPLARAEESATDDAKWEKRINKEIEIIEARLDDAQKGDRRAMAVLIRLADDEYINTAEGGEWLNEIYIELMVRHPYSFLLIVSKEEDKVRDRIVEELTNPVSDKYPVHILKAAALKAKKDGLKGEFIDNLIEFYSQDSQDSEDD